MWTADLHKLSEVQAHQTVVFDVAAIGNQLYTCSYDGCAVQAWDADTLERGKTLLEGDDEVWRLYVHDDQLFAGDVKGMVRVWSGGEPTQMYDLTEEVRGLAAQDSLLYTVRDRDLVITQTLPGEKARTVTRQTIEGSSPLCLVGTRICFASRSGVDILVHDNDKHTCFKQLGVIKAHTMIMNALCAEGSTAVYSGGYDCALHKWDVTTLQKLGAVSVGSCINAVCVGTPGSVYVGACNGYIARIHY